MYPPLILYPEGGTTNGTHLIKFKKGAFHALHSIQPILIRYSSPFLSYENCIYNFFAQSVLCSTCPLTRVYISEMPVFKPNEYFFKNHQREGEEKWETYARVIRDLMSQESGMKIMDVTIEEKFKYREYIYPAYKGKHSD